MTRTLGAVLLAEAIAIGVMLMITADQVAHTHVEQQGGVNIWGYRGPVAPQRERREIRIAFVGGTRAFSWGGAASESMPAAVRWMVTLTNDRAGERSRKVVGLNLGVLGAPASSYPARLKHYAYLRPDYVCIYDDLGRESSLPPRKRSVVFAAVGYAPALPLVLEEKGMALRYGSVMAGYAGAAADGPGAGRRAVGGLLMAVGGVARRLDESLPPAPSGDYVDGMAAAVEVSRGMSRGVVIAVGPAETDGDREKLRALRARLAPLLAHDRTLRLVDLTDVPSLREPGLLLDGYNYGAEGRARVAAAVTPSLLDLMATDAAR